ncbi:DNA-directed RNA polymerase subunit beta' [Mycoplasmopsis synoviae]|uniref:DNA-directed RNA polymerase subunit beta' n=3 Tax=Mycoplasmopsis TaxID=2767358 RepID=A0AAX3F083_MYCSY|nr:DNA-directed RNA polymerase subunit beta' [Mycoplasmopsis synoviae]ULL02242.1 DNA-directed RNA polymerase subunit beta' [Mycoplasmopsis synoviae]UZW63585.1 DNA-directed RNA polymerase subunit beta' [Mycoplasmopsis synoviae]UZW64247.1 DNA-directed RNA polymerase subunit beta' [Mycoplasmopsis synoviae]
MSNTFSKNNVKKIKQISLSLATNEDVLSWSNGVVSKPETINYKTYKPEKDGLFDEIIFGPVTDFKCPICFTKYKKSDENTICKRTTSCEKIQPKILPKISRRSRMGHIALNNPVVHFWFFKINHSTISKLLGLKVAGSNKPVTKSDLEKIIYYKSHIVLETGGLKSLQKNTIIDINDAADIYAGALEEILEFNKDNKDGYEEILDTLNDLKEYAASKTGQDYGIDFYEYNEIIEEYSQAKIGTGSKAIEYLLKNIDLEKESKEIQDEIDTINDQNKYEISSSEALKRNKLYKRLAIIKSFLKSGQKPENLLIYNLPVIPADLRPLVQLDGGRHSTSDINELYRRIIIRNNRLEKWYESDAPVLIKQNEFRMLQEAVDALIDNSRKKPGPVTSKDGHPFKSISDALVGKKGRFRQNLLGKRVDYSGRSVIVVGPHLKMYQVGIPRDMAAKLFEPWIINRIMKEEEGINSVKAAKKLVDSLNPIIWPYVEQVLENRPVLLNRAPTLHRLSIQAFQPVLIRGKAIKIHPLVTTAFNADFDGDQMAVHVPISKAAVREAQELMLASKNILGPKDGEPIINPSQDIILGLYYLTIEKANQKNEGKFYPSFNEMMLAYENKYINLATRVVLPISALKKISILQKTDAPYIYSTVGKFILNNAFPRDFDFVFGKRVAEKLTSTNEHGEEVVSLKTKIDTSEHDIKRYVFNYGDNFTAKIKEADVNLPLNKKEIAKIVRSIYEKYVPIVNIEDISQVINKIDKTQLDKLHELCSELKDFNGNKLEDNRIHLELLVRLIKEEFLKIQDQYFAKDEESIFNYKYWELKHYTKLLERVWFRYSNYVSTVLDIIKDLGFKFSTKSGITISMNDIVTSKTTKERIKKAEEETETLKDYFKKGYLTDDERYTLTIKKWSDVKESIEKELKKVVDSNLDNPLFMMLSSGARGTYSNFTQLAGMRGLMNNNTKILKADAENDRVVRSIVEIPVKSSFLDGLTAYEFYSSTHGARKGLTDTALNTAKSGYLTRRLVEVAQGVVIREEDCGSDYGFVVKDIKDTKTNTIIESLQERIEGRFTAVPIYDQNGKLIVKESELITPEIASEIVAKGITKVEIRSVLSCHTRNGLCKKCYGKDLATNRIVNIGEAVGVIAAQSIGEPGTQLTMRTFHTGGVAGGEDITGGFGRLIELIDAYDQPWGTPAEISRHYGKVKKIETQKNKKGKESGQFNISVEYFDEDGNKQTHQYLVKSSQRLRVKQGDEVVAGQKLSEGPIVLNELLESVDTRAVQNYILKEVQKLYRLQGIAIADKYIEIIIRQMLSKISIIDPGDSSFYSGSLVDTFVYQKENGILLSQGKKPAYGVVKIKGAKQTPLLSDSWLAAASYQETAKILVDASIAKRTDNLEGLKENIIIGYKIPAGTNSNFEENGKYNLKEFSSYFPNKYDSTPELKLEEITDENIEEEFDYLKENTISEEEFENLDDDTMYHLETSDEFEDESFGEDDFEYSEE